LSGSLQHRAPFNIVAPAAGETHLLPLSGFADDAEIVEWLVLTDPVQVAEADVAGFAKLYPLNARPVQKDNRRYVLQSS
jgi:hypothetical protein